MLGFSNVNFISSEKVNPVTRPQFDIKLVSIYWVRDFAFETGYYSVQVGPKKIGFGLGKEKPIAFLY
jgi:hypothetical protein